MAGAPPGVAALLQGTARFGSPARRGPVHGATCWMGGLPDSEIDLLEELRTLTARIAARVVLDADIEGYGPSEGRSGMLPFVEAYGEDYDSTPGGDPTAPLVMVRPRAPRRMDAVLRIIDERIASGEERGDVLSDLVQARFPDGEKLTRDDIVGEVIQMLYAGHLTIPSSLVNFWRDIAANDVARSVADEAARLCATGPPESAALSGSYCLATLKESMRLHPPAPILYREVESPFELGGFEFARDVAVWVSPQLLHSDARFFPQPHRFLPERFMKGRLSVASESVYLAFGAGPRDVHRQPHGAPPDDAHRSPHGSSVHVDPDGRRIPAISCAGSAAELVIGP